MVFQWLQIHDNLDIYNEKKDRKTKYLNNIISYINMIYMNKLKLFGIGAAIMFIIIAFVSPITAMEPTTQSLCNEDNEEQSGINKLKGIYFMKIENLQLLDKDLRYQYFSGNNGNMFGIFFLGLGYIFKSFANAELKVMRPMIKIPGPSSTLIISRYINYAD